MVDRTNRHQSLFSGFLTAHEPPRRALRPRSAPRTQFHRGWHQSKLSMRLRGGETLQLPSCLFCTLCRSFRCQEPPREVVLATLQRLWCGRWRASLPFLRRRLRRSTKLPVHLRCQPIAFVGAARTRAPPQLCSHAHGQRCVSTPGDYNVMDLTTKFGTRPRAPAVVASLSAKCTARQALGTRPRFLFFC